MHSDVYGLRNARLIDEKNPHRKMPVKIAFYALPLKSFHVDSRS